MYFVFNTEAEADTKVAEISEGYFTTRPAGEWTTVKYCDIVECIEGYAIIADEVTAQYIQSAPQAITFPPSDII